MNVAETAREVGVNERTVRRWIARGQLHSVKQGRFVEIDIRDARALASPRAAAALSELDELATLRARYAELSERYTQLLQLLAAQEACDDQD